MATRRAAAAAGMTRSVFLRRFSSGHAGPGSAAMRQVHVKVPGTSANMGPGFDCFGIALHIHNELLVTRAPKFSIDVEGDSTGVPLSKKNIIVTSFLRGLAAGGAPKETLHSAADKFAFVCKNLIPTSRGMGSSSAAIVAGLAAGLSFCGRDVSDPATRALLLQLAADVEGHPDNVAPAIFGGFQLSFGTPILSTKTCLGAHAPHAHADEVVVSASSAAAVEALLGGAAEAGAAAKPPAQRWHAQGVRVPALLRAFVFVPDPPSASASASSSASGAGAGGAAGLTKTQTARTIVPATFSRQDMVFNLSRAALMVNAFSRGRVAEDLRSACDDRIHEPARGPGAALEAIRSAAYGAGAHGAWLSGAGPSVLALLQQHHGHGQHLHPHAHPQACGGTGGGSSTTSAPQSQQQQQQHPIAQAMLEAAQGEGKRGHVKTLALDAEGVCASVSTSV